MTDKQYPPLPYADFYVSQAVPEDTPVYTADQMRAYVDADRAQRFIVTNEQIEQLALEHEDFGFGRADKSGLSMHGFSPEGLSAFAHALICAALNNPSRPDAPTQGEDK